MTPAAFFFFFFLSLQALTNAEQQQCLHAQKFLGGDLEPSKFLREVPHSDTLAVHPGLVHTVSVEETDGERKGVREGLTISSEGMSLVSLPSTGSPRRARCFSCWYFTDKERGCFCPPTHPKSRHPRNYSSSLVRIWVSRWNFPVPLSLCFLRQRQESLTK